MTVNIGFCSENYIRVTMIRYRIRKHNVLLLSLWSFHRRRALGVSISFPWRNSLQWARASSLPMLHDHTQTHHTRKDSSGRVISPKQRNLPDKTQQLQGTNIHASGGILTRNPTKPAAAGPRLRPSCQWDRQVQIYSNKMNVFYKYLHYYFIHLSSFNVPLLWTKNYFF